MHLFVKCLIIFFSLYRVIYGIWGFLIFLGTEVSAYSSHFLFGDLSLIDTDNIEDMDPYVQEQLRRFRELKEWRENEDGLPYMMPSIIWWLILSVFTLYALYHDSKRSFGYFFLLSTIRFCVSTCFWTISCFLGYEFEENKVIKFVSLVLENIYRKDQCDGFEMSYIIRTVNLVPPNINHLDRLFPSDFESMFLYYEIVMTENIFYSIKLSDIFSCFIWYQMYQLWQKDVKVKSSQQKKRFKVTSDTQRNVVGSNDKKYTKTAVYEKRVKLKPEIKRNVESNDNMIVKKTKQDKIVKTISQIQRAAIVSDDERVEIDWLWHSCLYGHKDILKRILEKFADSVNINETKIGGNTALHFGIFGNHLSVIHILVGKFGKELNLTMRNIDGFNPLDLAITKKNSAIAKLLCKHSKPPEMSSLICAVESDQPEFVQLLREELKEPLILVSKQYDLFAPLQRFIDVCKEAELKSTNAIRRKECKVL